MTMIERELISRIRNPWGDCALVVLLMALALVVTPVNASNVCTCECCDSGSCVHGTNITFAVPTCSDCSKDVCKERIAACVTAPSIVAACVNRDSMWNKLSVVTFLVTVSCLAILAAVKDRVPWLKEHIRTK